MKRSAIVFGFSLFLMGNQSIALMPANKIFVNGYVYTDPYPLKIASRPINGVKVYLQLHASVLNKQAIMIRSYLDSSVTDVNGLFVFKSVPAANYTITLQHQNFVTRNEFFSASKDTTLNLALLASGAHAGLIVAVKTGVMTAPSLVPGSGSSSLLPVPQCTVRVWVNPAYDPLQQIDPAAKMPLQAASFIAVTSSQGTIYLDSIPISYNKTRVVVTASKAGFSPMSVDTSLWNSTITLVKFSLTSRNRDTAEVTPVNPTTGDSIAFNLFKANVCCCAVFVNPQARLSDSMVVLSYSLDTRPCAMCKCFAPGVWHTFRSKPLKAGKYGIYTNEGCPPDMICTMIYNPPVRVGEFVVTNTLTPVRPVAAEPVLTRLVTFKQEKNSITLYGAHANAGNITVRIFNSRGILAGEMQREQAAPGSYRFSWTARARGIYLLAVKAGGEPVSFHRVVISR